jgi:biotin synthase-like enzyme
MPRKQITAERIERAEMLVRVYFSTGEWPHSALDALAVDHVGFKKFIDHNVETLRAMYRDIDPRHEAAIATMFTHLFLTGIAAGRQMGYSEDEGL